MTRSPFLEGALAWIHGVDPPSSCAECGFDWNLGYAEALDVIRAAPDTIEGELARGDGMVEPTDGSWNATAYVWHLTDLARSWTERWVQIRNDPGSELVGFDPDEVAAARNYRRLPTTSGLWAVREAVGALLDQTAALRADSEFVHGDWGTGTVADAMRWLAHEFGHHIQDIRSRVG